jgi:hypothetical protein
LRDQCRAGRYVSEPFKVTFFDRIYIDMTMGVCFGLLLVYFLSQSISLIVQLHDSLDTEKLKRVPGMIPLVILTVIVSVATFLSMIFVPYEDLAKLAGVSSMNGLTNTWQGILTTQMVCEIYLTVTVFAAIYLFYRTESAIAMAHDYRSVAYQKRE